MIYEYMNEETGHKIERDFRMGQAPKSVEEDGKIYNRHFGPLKVVNSGEFFRSAHENTVKFKNAPLDGSDMPYGIT